MLRIPFKSASGAVQFLNTPSDITVGMLKEHLVAKIGEPFITVDRIHLVYDGRELEDGSVTGAVLTHETQAVRVVIEGPNGVNLELPPLTPSRAVAPSPGSGGEPAAPTPAPTPTPVHAPAAPEAPSGVPSREVPPPVLPTRPMRLLLKSVDGKLSVLNCPPSDTVLQLKQRILDHFLVDMGLTTANVELVFQLTPEASNTLTVLEAVKNAATYVNVVVRTSSGTPVSLRDPSLAAAVYSGAGPAVALYGGAGVAPAVTGPSTTPSASSAGTASGGGSGSGAGSGSSPGPVPPTVVALHFRKMDGGVATLEVDPTTPFEAIKILLEPVVGINASRIRLICRGKALSDSVSPASAGTTQETLVHIVKNKASLAEKLCPKTLRANCRKCETAGAMFEPRPMCPVCGSESVLWTAGRPKIAKTNDPDEVESASTFGDLLNWKISCMQCGDPDDAELPAAVGFLCVTTRQSAQDFVCESRHADGLSRLQHVYREGGAPALEAALTGLFSYATGAGLETDPLAATR